MKIKNVENDLNCWLCGYCRSVRNRKVAASYNTHIDSYSSYIHALNLMGTFTVISSDEKQCL